MSLYTELRKRHVLEIALVYLGVAWLFIEITQFVVGNYGFSRKVLDAVFLIAALGFPAFIVIAWFHGERGSQQVRRGEVSLLLTLSVLGAIGTYRIATGEEVPLTGAGDDAVVSAPSTDATLASSEQPEADLGRRSLAVLPFKNNVSDESLAWIGPGLADLLTTNFAQVPELRVVGRQSLYDLLTEEGRGESEEIPESLASTVARAAGARMMVWGTVTGTPEDLAIDAQLIELDDGTVLAAERVRGTDIFAMVDSLTARLTRRVAGERRGPPPVSISSFGTQDLEALAAFQHGVASERAGRRDEAAEYYEQAAGMDSTFMLPLIRLAGRGQRSSPSEAPGGVQIEVAQAGEFTGIEPFDDFDWENWKELDDDERRALRTRYRGNPEFGRRNAEMHKERAMHVLERMGEQLGMQEVGEGLVSRLQELGAEQFLLKFDSTLSANLSAVSVIVEEATADTAGRGER